MTRSDFPFCWVPGQTQPVQLFVLEIDPAAIQPAISVQPNWNNSQGLIRGRKAEDGLLIEDNIREELDEDGVLRDVGQVGIRIFGAEALRRQVWTVEEHLKAYKACHPNDIIHGVAGNGNLLSNPYFVGYTR